jgi:hypothetical protein
MREIQIKTTVKLGVVTYAYNPSTWEAKTREDLLSSGVQDQPEILFQK